MAALLAILPKIASWASITCHCRIMPSLDGNSVLIDTRLQRFLELQNIKLTEIRGSLSNRVTRLALRQAAYPCGRFFACSMAIWLMCDRAFAPLAPSMAF